MYLEIFYSVVVPALIKIPLNRKSCFLNFAMFCFPNKFSGVLQSEYYLEGETEGHPKCKGLPIPVPAIDTMSQSPSGYLQQL